MRLSLLSVFYNSVVDHSDHVEKRFRDHCPLSIAQGASRFSLLCPWFIWPHSKFQSLLNYFLPPAFIQGISNIYSTA